MDGLTVLIVLVALVAAATGLGLLHRHLRGRVKRSSGAQVISLDGLHLGERATLLQFSSAVCAPCVLTARVLGEIARTTPGTSHVDIDITDRPELAARFNLLQTPTTLLLDAHGVLRARIGGAVRRDTVAAELASILAGAAGTAAHR